LESALRIVLEGKKPFDAELVTPGVAMDMSEDFQAKAAAAGSSSPTLLYATLPPKRKSKGKGKAKAKSISVAPLGGLDNAIIILDSAPPPVPSNPGPPLWLTPPRQNPKALLGLLPLVNKVPLRAPAHLPHKATEVPAAKQFRSFAEVAKGCPTAPGNRQNPIVISSPSPMEAQKIQPSLIPYHHLPILEFGVFNILNISKPCRVKHLALLVGPGLRTNTKNTQS
jgi:hypothetical protein